MWNVSEPKPLVIPYSHYFCLLVASDHWLDFSTVILIKLYPTDSLLQFKDLDITKDGDGGGGQ